MSHRFPAAIFVVLFFSAGLFAQDESLLDLSRIYEKNEFASASFSRDFNETSPFFLEKIASDQPCGGYDIVKMDPISGEKTVLVRAEELVPGGETKPLDFSSYQFTKNTAAVLLFTNTKKVWRHHTRGDYWVLDRASGQLRKLGGDAKPSTLQFAKFSPEGRRVAYVRENNIYVEDLVSGSILPITNNGGERFVNGTFDWAYEEELDLRDGFSWSPDGESIAYWQLDTEGVQIFSMINNTDSLYPKVTSFKYPKVGTVNSSARIGVVELKSVRNVRNEPSAAPSPDATRWIELPGDARNHYLPYIKWTAKDRLFVMQLNRLQNELVHFTYDTNAERLFRGCVETAPGWIDFDAPRWLADGKRFVMKSERDTKNRRLCLYSIEGIDKPDYPSAPSYITPEGFDVIDFAGFDRDAKGNEIGVYFYASPENATRKFLYRADLDGSNVNRTTPDSFSGGTHDYQISPDAKLAVHTYSSFAKPPISELVLLPSHETVKLLGGNEKLEEKLGKLKSGKTEFFTTKIEGFDVDGWCIYPPGFDPAGKYPVLVHVYGEPAGQTVLDRWGGSGYLWHQMMAQKGYVVLSFDNPGTPAAKGCAWRKSIYRQLGIIAPKAQADALAKTLETRNYLDPNRVGIWGWSGGGSMSLHALFQFPDKYKLAVAIAPVAHEGYYDTIYQERYMGLPDDNVEGYRDSSPITFAGNMKGKLLIIHGTADDNCHYQITELLIDELVRCGKQFIMMAYPNRSHSINEGQGTSLHLRTLMTNFIEQNL